MARTLRIATRGSQLALWQAHHVQKLLADLAPNHVVELVTVVSAGDADRSRPLHEIGGVGIFTKEVQEAILDGRADLAVHSLKDLPTVAHADLVLAAVPERGRVEDVLLSPKHGTLANLPVGARVATSSLRRQAQLLRHRPDLRIESIRGNVETRIRKLHDEQLDGLVLAHAGIGRLGFDAEVTEVFSTEQMLPAVGQGALGIECRNDDEELLALLRGIDHPETRTRVEAERAFLRTIQGGCQVPLGTATQIGEGKVHLQAIVLRPDGSRWIEESHVGPAAEANQVGQELARRMLALGAAELIAPPA